MTTPTNKSPAADKHAAAFRATAVDLAAQLQVASRTAAELAVAAIRAEQTIQVLRKFLPPAQLVHAQLEIEALQAQAGTAFAQLAAAPVVQFDGYEDDGYTTIPRWRILNRDALRAGMQLYATPITTTTTAGNQQ